MEELTVLPKYQSLMKSAGLERFRDFFEYAEGRKICHKRGRSVFRVAIGRQAFYLKRNLFHWVECWKALSRFRWPDLGSRREWENIRALERAGICTSEPVATGRKYLFGLETASFTLTAEIPGARPLDAIVRNRFEGEGFSTDCRGWRQLIQSLADLACRLHREGMYHQDFYLNHFFLDAEGQLYLLDLQRLRRCKKIPEHYRIKDLGQLNYSARESGVTRADRMRFLLAYLGRTSLGDADRPLVRRIIAKTVRIGRHDRKLRKRRRRRGELP